MSITPKNILDLAAKTVVDRLENGRIVTKRDQEGNEYTEVVPPTAAEINAALKVYETILRDTAAPSDATEALNRKLAAMGQPVPERPRLTDADEEDVA